MTNTAAFLKNSSFAERVLREINGTCVNTKRRGIEATCIVSGDREQPRISSYLSNKTLVVVSKQGYSDFVCTSLQTYLMTELNQKLTKRMARSRRCLLRGHLYKGKYQCKKSGAKEGEDNCSKRVCCWELTVVTLHYHCSWNMSLSPFLHLVHNHRTCSLLY